MMYIIALVSVFLSLTCLLYRNYKFDKHWDKVHIQDKYLLSSMRYGILYHRR